MDTLLQQDTWTIVFMRLLKSSYNSTLCDDFIHLLVKSTNWTDCSSVGVWCQVMLWLSSLYTPVGVRLHIH